MGAAVAGGYINGDDYADVIVGIARLYQWRL